MPAKIVLVDERDTKSDGEDTKIEDFLLSIFTPDIPNAGTDARVFFEIGEQKYFLSPKRYAANTGISVITLGVVLYTLGISINPLKDEFERGDTDVFTLPAGASLRMGDLRRAKIRLSHDGAGIGSDWFVGKIELMAHVEGESTYKTYKVWPPLEWLNAAASREAILQEAT